MMNILTPGSLSAIEKIIVSKGIEKALELLGTKVKAETPLAEAALALTTKALEQGGLVAYQAARNWLLRAVERKASLSVPWNGPAEGAPLRELSDALVAIQQAERSEKKKLQRAAIAASSYGEPFILQLANDLLSDL